MTDRFCTACGHPLQVGERFCDACGHPVTSEPSVPAPASPAAPTAAAPYPMVAPPGPPADDRRMWWIALGLGAAIIAVLVAVLVVSMGDDDEPTAATTPVVVTARPTTTTSTSTTTSTTRPTTTTVAPTTSPVPPPFDPGPDPTLAGFADPFEAVADWAWATGLNYQGDCSFLDPTADYGLDPWCGTLWEDRGSVEVYRVADFPGGDFAYWVLVGSGPDGWTVDEVAEDTTGTPPF
jgi:hypothetical protein